MPAFKCEKCYKIFNLKTDLERHHNKKNPCIEVGQIINDKAKEIAENVVSNNDDLNKVKKFLEFCHNTMRDTEGIVGMKALSNIAMLLFLKFVNNSVKSGNIDLLNIEQYRKEEGTDKEEKFQKYKKYIKYSLFENIIENGKFKVEVDELIFIVEYIFKHVLWFHPKTKKIFADEFPSIKHEITYEQILKRMDKIDWESMNIDIKGAAYEHFLKSEMGGGDLGQFFTRREIVDYMIKIIKPEIKENSTFIDPFMGTGGFITHMFNEIRNIYIQKKIPFLNNIKNNLVNGIEKNPQTCLLALNNMLLNMDLYPTNIKCDDSLRNYTDKKYDFVLTNPPFGIKGLMYDNESMFPDEINGIKKKDYLPYKSNDAICLALQMIPYILKKNGTCAIVVPDGKQLTSEKEKSIVSIRKMLIENNNLYQVTSLPNGCFLPYTGVSCCVLFFKKGEKTKNVKFVKLNDDYINEKLLSNVPIDKITKRNYSLNHKLYIETTNKYIGLQYEKLENICKINYGTRIVKKEASEGHYPVYGGGDITFYTNSYNREGENCIISRFGMSENCVRLTKDKLWLNDSGLTLESINTNVQQNYLNYFMLLNNKIIYNIGSGVAQKNLSIDDFKNLQIPIPPLEIQNLIVQELDSMYEQKESLQKSINNMNTLRKAKFEMLLENCEGKQNIKLENLCELNKNNKNNKEYDNYNYIDISSVEKGTLIDNKIIKREDLPSRAKRICLNEDILLSSVRPNLENYLFLTNDILKENTLISTGFIVITSNKKIVNPKFLYYHISSSAFTEKIIKKTTGANYPSITCDDIKDIILTIPSLQDQQKIVEQMEKYDKLVELQQEQVLDIEQTIKDRFDYHLNKCKEAQSNEAKITEDNTSKSSKDDADIDLEAELEEINKKSKTSKIKIVEPIESVIVGKVECIEEEGKYYRLINGEKGELYAITKNDKVVLYKKNSIKKV